MPLFVIDLMSIFFWDSMHVQGIWFKNRPFPSYGGHLVWGDKNALFEITIFAFWTRNIWRSYPIIMKLGNYVDNRS